MNRAALSRGWMMTGRLVGVGEVPGRRLGSMPVMRFRNKLGEVDPEGRAIVECEACSARQVGEYDRHT